MKLVISGENNPAKPKFNSIKLLALISSFFLTITGINASKDAANKVHSTPIIYTKTICSTLILMNWKKTHKNNTGSPIQRETTRTTFFFSYISERTPPISIRLREKTLIDPNIKPNIFAELVMSKMTHPWMSDIEIKAKWKKKIEEKI